MWRARHVAGIACVLGVLASLGFADWVENHAQAEKALLQALSDDAMWTEEAHKDELRAHLQAVRVLRPEGLVPALVAHIDYQPVYKAIDAFNPPYRPSPKEQFPAATALAAIGLPAVAAILHEMRGLDGDPPVPPMSPMYMDAMRRRGRAIRRANRLAFCLRDIYDVGGNGAQVAYLRIQLEAEKTAGKERENLLKFLEHPAFLAPLPAP
jgi:hypothetical protein